MMKVLVCIPCLLTGGTEIQTLSLVEALIASGHKVDVACYFEYSETMVDRYIGAGARVHLFSSDGERPAGVKAVTKALYCGLKRVVKETRPDVAHVQYMAPGAIPIVILRMLGVKRVIATAHTAGDIYSSRGLKLLKFINNHLLKAFQCITERAEKSFFGTSQLFGESTKLSGRGNHFTIYNSLPSYIGCRDAGRCPGERITIGVVSRLEPIKGMDLVIPAFARVLENMSESTASPVKVNLLIVGDGTLRLQMEREAEQSGVSGHVEFAGRRNQNELQDFYDRIDILLMPSRSEGFGLTAIEGMARGCVPVVSDIGGLPEVVRDGRDGLLHEPESIDAISVAITSLLTDRARMQAYSASAVSRASVFTPAEYTRQIAALYRQLIQLM